MIVLDARSRVKVPGSIAVIPSSLVIFHENEQHVVALLILDADASVHLKTAAVSLILYVRAGVANLFESIVKGSNRQGFVITTKMLKF